MDGWPCWEVSSIPYLVADLNGNQCGSTGLLPHPGWRRFPFRYHSIRMNVRKRVIYFRDLRFIRN